jgi:hypothetical protein
MISKIHGRNIVGSHLLLRLILTGLLLIVLLASSAGQARSAGIQQDKPIFTIYSRELQKKGYVCVGEKIRIIVRVLTSHKPKPNLVVLEYVSGFQVTALVTGSTGIITPEKALVGHKSMVPEGAEFVFQAKKIGKEKIFFEALVPDPLFLTPDIYIEQPLEFDVKKCKYKASLIYRSQQFAWSVNRTGWWMEYGNMEEVLLEPDEQGNFEVVGLYQFGGYLTNMAECPWTFTGSDLQVDIAGNLREDVVNLAFDFGFPEITVSFCAGSYTSPPAALLGQQDAAIPITGGVTNIIVPVPYGAPAPNGTAAIYVILQPEAEQAVSRADHSVAWLPGWFETTFLLPGKSR